MRPAGSNLLVVVGIDGSGRTHRLADGTDGRATTALHPGQAGDEVADLLGSARDTDALVLADDADLLAGDVLALLADVVRSGQSLRMSRRPVVGTPELGRLDALVAAAGDVVELAPLDPAGVGAMLARIRGGPVDPAEAESLWQASAGLPVHVAAAATADTARGARVRARISHQLARIGPQHQRLLELLALADNDVHDDVLARAIDTDRHGLSTALSALRLAGLVAPGTDHLVPIVAESVREVMSPASQREVHDALARALLATSGPGAASQLRAANVHTAEAVAAYVAEGERIRYDDPARAAEWFDLALASGARTDAVVAGMAETAVLLGQPVVPEPTAEPDIRVAIATGVGAAHQGRPARAAELLLSAPGSAPALAVVPLMATADLARAEAISTATAPIVVALLADGARALADPARAVPLLIEAAEAMEAAPDVLLPDTPHAVGAIAAVVAGDVATAEHLLVRACDELVGGPAGLQRHRLLLAWLWATTGHVDRARAELLAVAGERGRFPGRERLLVAAVRAALARRSGEASQLREAWSEARPALARRTVDLLAAPLLEDLVVAAARMREPDLVAATVGDLETAIGKLGEPASWRVLLGWIRLQAAVAIEDADAAHAAATMLADLAPGPARQRAQVAAAPVWADALAGRVDLARVSDRARALADAGADWDASRLCGNAALRATDVAVSRQLLEQARDLAANTRARGEEGAGGVLSALSEREVEVARLVVAGETYKVIGARLFLSPKTVEHHVARIRTKLGAASRAELITLLREGGL